LTTPIGPPLLLPIRANPDHQKMLRSINESFHRGPGIPSPASRDAVAGSEPLMLSVRVHLTRPARLTSSETVCYCTVVEIATHPILRVIEVDRVNPIHSHPTRVCVSCVTNTGLPKSSNSNLGAAGKAVLDSNCSWSGQGVRP